MQRTTEWQRQQLRTEYPCHANSAISCLQGSDCCQLIKKEATPEPTWLRMARCVLKTSSQEASSSERGQQEADCEACNSVSGSFTWCSSPTEPG